MSRSTTPLASASPASQKRPGHGQLPAEAGVRIGRLAQASVQRALAVGGQRLGQATEGAQAAGHRPGRSGASLTEDQSAGA